MYCSAVSDVKRQHLRSEQGKWKCWTSYSMIWQKSRASGAAMEVLVRLGTLGLSGSSEHLSSSGYWRAWSLFHLESEVISAQCGQVRPFPHPSFASSERHLSVLSKDVSWCQSERWAGTVSGMCLWAPRERAQNKIHCSVFHLLLLPALFPWAPWKSFHRRKENLETRFGCKTSFIEFKKKVSRLTEGTH